MLPTTIDVSRMALNVKIPQDPTAAPVSLDISGMALDAKVWLILFKSSSVTICFISGRRMIE